MKRFGIAICFALMGYNCLAQSVDLKELTNLLDLAPGKLESHLQKKGYRRAFEEQGNGIYFERADKSGDRSDVRGFRIVPQQEDFELDYQTTSPEEYGLLKAALKSNGFVSPATSDDAGPVLYQRQNVTIESFRTKADTNVFYVLRASKINLPRAKDIVSAEDLLSLNGQQYLIDLFGSANVKKDWFYFTENDSNACSVIFPNTSREAIFIWNDQVNMRDISFIVIGGSLRTKDATSLSPVSHNEWQSKQGLYCGMTLPEVTAMNGAPVKFYGWKAASAGYLAPNNKGRLDFGRVGLVFNCMNCAFLRLGNEAIVDSDQAREENQKVFVTTMIILPERKASLTVSRK